MADLSTDERMPEMSESAQSAPERAQTPPEKSKRRRLAAMLVVPAVLILASLGYWWSLLGKESTDNAYLKLDRVSISAEVGGRIVEIAVRENQKVRKGDVLFRIDPEPYRIALQAADAAIAAAEANVKTLANSRDLSGADVEAARESIAFSRSNLERIEALYQRGFATKADYEAAQHALAQAQAALEAALARQREARARLARSPRVGGQYPAIAEARARREEALLSLERTVVRAPFDGRIAEADRLQIGQQVVASLPVLTLVRDDGAYVEANFKETQLANMRPGQRAKIRLDAYPDLTLEGKVESIGAGTGSEFSIIPAQNATGNWVKVTQRVPVRIAITSNSDRELIAGLSAEVTVFTSDRGARRSVEARGAR